MDDYAQKGKVRPARKRARCFQPGELDLRSRRYDGIMLNTYRALNYLDWARPTRHDRKLTCLPAPAGRRAGQREAQSKKSGEAAKNKDSAGDPKAQDDGKCRSKSETVPQSPNHCNVRSLRQFRSQFSRRSIF